MKKGKKMTETEKDLWHDLYLLKVKTTIFFMYKRDIFTKEKYLFWEQELNKLKKIKEN